jgi:hypothetical protein
LYVDRQDRWRRLFIEGRPGRRLGELPRRGAGHTRVDDVRIALAILIALAIVGCSDMPKDGRYQPGGGGWDNFRAEAGQAFTVSST